MNLLWVLKKGAITGSFNVDTNEYCFPTNVRDLYVLNIRTFIDIITDSNTCVCRNKTNIVCFEWVYTGVYV